MKEDIRQSKEHRRPGHETHEGHAGHKDERGHGSRDHAPVRGDPQRGHEHDRDPRHDHHERRHHGERGGRGEHDGPRDRARRGEARYVLLDALRDGPKHGYEIIKALEERSAGQYAPSPGTVYPTLQYLEDQALVRADQEAERRVYHLTKAGQAELDARAEDVSAFWSRFTARTVAEASRHDVNFLQESLDDLNRTVWRGLRDAIERGDQDVLRRVRQSVEQCRSDIRVIIADASAVAPAQKAARAK